MSDPTGTEGDDVYDQKALGITDWLTYTGLGGNDTIRMFRGGTTPGAGNDIVEKYPTTNVWETLGVNYWDAPNGVVVDLAAGFAEDGWGTRDTLINVDSVNAGGHDDKLYGSATDNQFSPGGGHDLVDGRGGIDSIVLPWIKGAPLTWDQLTVVVSVDGRDAKITSAFDSNFSLDLHDVELLALDWNMPFVELSSFITPQAKAQEAIAAGAAFRWNAGQPLGTSVAVSYSFVASAPASGLGEPQFRPFSAAEQQLVRDILVAAASVTGLTFTEVSENAGAPGQMRFGVSQQAASKGISWLPGQSGAGDAAGDVWMDVESMTGIAPGTEGYAALLHEIGHALGLRHPRNTDPGDAWATQLRAIDDTTANTVMSSEQSSDGLYRAAWGPLDVLALRYLYGSKTVAAGDTNYVLGGERATSQTTIIDDNGNDTLDASAYQIGVQLNLKPGALSSVGQNASGMASVDNLALGGDTWIENAVGSKFDDVIIGNERDNRLSGGLGNDWLEGGAGTDTAVYAQASRDYLFTYSFGRYFVAAYDRASGTDTLTDIEQAAFSDGVFRLAFRASDAASADLAGTAGNDILIGTDSNDRLSGLGGNDIFASGTGNDLLDGGEGADRAQFGGRYADYALTRSDSAGTWTVTARNGTDGAATLTSVEELQFADLIINFANMGFDGAPANLIGTAANESLTGSGADNRLAGMGGNDNLDGGAGLDTAIYLGQRNNFDVTKTATGFTVADKTGIEGNDTLSNVERIVFADATMALDIRGTAGQAYRIYQAAFDRTPDSGGLGFWIAAMDKGMPLAKVAATFVSSAEFVALYGAAPSNADLVYRFYQNVLHRAPDGGGAAFWIGLLDSHTLTVAQVLESFSESPENQDALIGLIGNGFVYTAYGA